MESQEHRAERRSSFYRRLNRASAHQLGDAAAGQLGRILEFGNHAPLPHHYDMGGDCAHFFELMADEDHGEAALGHRPNRLEQALRLLWS